MVLGALLAAWAGKDFDTIRSINAAGDKVFSGFGAIVLLFAALGLVSVTALNMYGGSLTLISAIDSFKRVRPTLGVRLVTIGLTAALSLVGALAATSNFLENFNNFLLLVLYLFIPWTAVNLMDYYVVRRGHYAIAEIFNPRAVCTAVGAGTASSRTWWDSPSWSRSSPSAPSTPAPSQTPSTAPTSPCSSVCRSPRPSTGG